MHHGRPRLVAVDVEIEPLLAERFFGLTDRRILAPALVDRHGQLRDGRELRQPDHLEGGVLPLQHAARDREVRIERAFADLDGKLGNIDAIGRGKNRGALRLALRDRPCKHVGRQPVDRRARSERARIDADHPAIIRSRCHVLRLGGEKLRASGGEPRFGLRHVGARHFADVEAVARLLELFGENFDVAPLQIEHRLIAQQIHVSGRGIEQHLLLGDTQGLARRVHLTFRLTASDWRSGSR